jgi:hypothetical protein
MEMENEFSRQAAAVLPDHSLEINSSSHIQIGYVYSVVFDKFAAGLYLFAP